MINKYYSTNQGWLNTSRPVNALKRQDK